jgi:hypothetical protein
MFPMTNAKLRVMEGLVTPVIPAAVLSGNPDFILGAITFLGNLRSLCVRK